MHAVTRVYKIDEHFTTFHSRAKKHRINGIHERTLRLIYPNQSQLPFKVFIEKNKTVNIHQRNLQNLATEIYEIKNKISLYCLSLLR